MNAAQEPVEWVLCRDYVNGVREIARADGPAIPWGDSVRVVRRSAYDALLAERDALKAELVTERRWAERMKSPELLRTVLVNQLADQIDALKAALAALKIENAELDATTNMQHLILDATATVLKGPPAPLSLHSFADLAQVAAALKEKHERVWKAAAHLHGIVATDNYGHGTCFVCEKCGEHGHDEDSTCPASPEWLANIRDGKAQAPDFLTTSATESREAKGGEQC